MRALRDHPESTRRPASQSSNSGWVGRSPRTPKSSGVGTSPSPKSCIQMSLAMTRGGRGFSPSTSQRPRSRRSPVVPRWRIAGSTERVAGATASSGSLNSPRRRMRVSRRSERRSPRTRTSISGASGFFARWAAASASRGRVSGSSCSRWRKIAPVAAASLSSGATARASRTEAGKASSVGVVRARIRMRPRVCCPP